MFPLGISYRSGHLSQGGGCIALKLGVAQYLECEARRTAQGFLAAHPQEAVWYVFGERVYSTVHACG